MITVLSRTKARARGVADSRKGLITSARPVAFTALGNPPLP